VERRRAKSQLDKSVSPGVAAPVQQGEDPVADELSRKMLSWSSLWFGSPGSVDPSEEQERVRQRLLSWLERCIGRKASAVLTNRVEDVSLATSTPLLTAFLGRRAMLELSRRVLNEP
jgi:hypothetical protein